MYNCCVGWALGVDKRVHAWSITKSVLSALIGVRLRQGQISLADPLYAPEWGVTSNSPAAASSSSSSSSAAAAAGAASINAAEKMRRNITVQHALHMSTGLEFQEQYSALVLYDPSIMLFGERSTAHYSAQKRLAHPPGTHWFVLCYAMLCYTILYYPILYYAMLCCDVI